MDVASQPTHHPFQGPASIAAQTANRNAPEGAFIATTGQAAHHAGLFSGPTFSFEGKFGVYVFAKGQHFYVT